MHTSNIMLDEEKETLFVPLYGKAMESSRKIPMLNDIKAVEIVDSIDYDFSSLKIPAKTNTMMCLRAKLVDNFTELFIRMNPECMVLHLGCGLDSRCSRINISGVEWFDLDYPEVIDIRIEFFPESKNYHLIASSVTDIEWIENLPDMDKPKLVIAEGLFMYLKEDEIKDLFGKLNKKFGKFTIIFDAYSVYTAKKVKRHPSIKKTGAVVNWGIDNPLEIEEWQDNVTFIKEIFFTKNEEIDNQSWGTKFMYKLAHLFPMARNAQRILIYQVG